jgi:hypothetical protein
MAIDWDKVLLGPVINVFGEGVLYTPQAGASFDVTLVYDEANKDLDLAGGTGVNTSNPLASGRLSDFLTQPQQGDMLMIKRTGESFVVKDVETDGHGAVKLMLNFAGPGL